MDQETMELPVVDNSKTKNVQMPELRAFHTIFKSELRSKGMKQYELANDTGICTSTLSKILKGSVEPKWHEFKALIDALEIDFNRAWLAVADLNNPDLYYDQKTQLTSSINSSLSKTLPMSDLCLIYVKPTLGPSIANMLTDVIAKQENSIAERANSIPEL